MTTKSYTKRSNCIRAARAALKAPHAEEGIHFNVIFDGPGAFSYALLPLQDMAAATEASRMAMPSAAPVGPATAPPVVAADDGIPAVIKLSPEERAAGRAATPLTTTAVLMAGVDKTGGGTPTPASRKKHAADLADLSEVPNAVHFIASLFVNGAFDKQQAETLDEARRQGSDMVARHASNRRSMIYAVMADGRSIFVPSDYVPYVRAAGDTSTGPAPTLGKVGKAAAKTHAKAPVALATFAAAADIFRPAKPNAAHVALFEAAKRGELPAEPDLSAKTHDGYRKHLVAMRDMVAKGDVAALTAYPIEPKCSSRIPLFRYRGLAVVALTARAAAKGAKSAAA